MSDSQEKKVFSTNSPVMKMIVQLFFEILLHYFFVYFTIKVATKR